MAYEITPSGNKWAKQYRVTEIPVYLNTSDSGEVMDYAPKDRRDDEDAYGRYERGVDVDGDCWMCADTGDASFPDRREVPCTICPNGVILRSRLILERRASEAVEPPKLQREGSTPSASAKANDNLFVPECLFEDEEESLEIQEGSQDCS